MLILQSFERARDFARLDPTTGQLDFFSQTGEERERLQAHGNGQFSSVDGSIVLVYRNQGVLVLRLRDKDYVIDDMTSSRLEKAQGVNKLLKVFGRQNKFELVRKGEPVVSFEYTERRNSRIVFDPTFTDDEDTDFMLFIHHLLSDPERRNNAWI